MALALGFSHQHSVLLSQAAGLSEIALAAAIAFRPYWRWPYRVTLLLMPILLAYTAWAAPQLLGAAFNPVVCNIALAGLALVALHHLPRAGASDA